MFTKKYFQDRPILFLNLSMVLVTILTLIYSVISIDSSKQSVILCFRVADGIDGFSKTNSFIDLYSFAIAAILFTGVAIFMSAKYFKNQKFLSHTILALTLITLLFNFVVCIAVINLQ